MINLFRYGVLLLTMQIAVAQLDVAYVRYFQDDHNFLSNLSMMSTSRRGVAHLTVSYNEKDLPIKIERITAKGNIEKREMLKYDETGKLIERGEYTDKWKYLNLTVIGDNEPWSQEFRAWRFARNEPLTFTDQRTYFTIQDGIQISKIVFETVDGQKYGQVELDYDYLGSLKEERWRDLPSARIIRRFKYKFDLLTEFIQSHAVVQIWEFGHDDALISHVAIDQAPSDQLYKTPPPRSHNTLDEVDIIAREIKESRIIVPHGAFIPRTTWDELIMVTGDRLMVDFVDMTDNGIKFRMENERDILTVPFHRVRSLTSRVGDVIYPKAIHIKTP
ncbi:MAG TPA: hypothetical protein EYM60_05795 [Candidatus Marinimicrobia bacterium]|nr:hypothetical protein [Candidatus Neomarinimicrobiota bacterium]